MKTTFYTSKQKKKNKNYQRQRENRINRNQNIKEVSFNFTFPGLSKGEKLPRNYITQKQRNTDIIVSKGCTKIKRKRKKGTHNHIESNQQEYYIKKMPNYANILQQD